MPNQTAQFALQRWLSRPNADTFPFNDVITEFRSVGKHFVTGELLAVLSEARASLPEGADALRQFLNTALDKYDGRFDNPSYLALHDLPLPTTAGGCPLDTAGAEMQHDKLILLLVADVLRFEIAAHDGTTDLLPLMRPDKRTIAKRCILGLRALRTTMTRLGIDAFNDINDPIESARELCVRIQQTAEDRRMLAVTLLPVSTVHDEHLFIRMLQCYETVFALVTVQLRAAIIAAKAGKAAHATRALRTAASAMKESSPLFSLVATMQPGAFMTFREYTDGASAIQSRSYKTIESLCRRPDPERLVGPGYDAVPEVRARVLTAQPTLEEALVQSPLELHELAEIRAAMAAFEDEVMGWRKTHYNLALRVLGMRRGTGYTAGVPYLAEAKNIPLFKCPFAESGKIQ